MVIHLLASPHRAVLPARFQMAPWFRECNSAFSISGSHLVGLGGGGGGRLRGGGGRGPGEMGGGGWVMGLESPPGGGRAPRKRVPKASAARSAGKRRNRGGPPAWPGPVPPA